MHRFPTCEWRGIGSGCPSTFSVGLCKSATLDFQKSKNENHVMRICSPIGPSVSMENTRASSNLPKFPEVERYISSALRANVDLGFDRHARP